MSERITRALKAAVVVVVVAYVAREVARQWHDFAALPATINVNWALVAASGAVVLASYALLIWTWQHTVRAWGDSLGFADGARIWFVSNLGRYVPGKVWQIGAMGLLSQRVGVSPVAAVGSSLVVSVVNVLAGIAVAAACGAGRLDAPAWAVPLTAALAAGVLAAPWILPVVARTASRVLKRPIAEPRLPHSAVWVAALGCAVAWLLYGIAFHLLQVALLGPSGDVLRSTAAFTGSYIAGFLFLLAPGGIGIREVVLQQLLERFGIATGADAWLLVLASRGWLTVLEIIPGLLYLGFARRAGTSPSGSVK